MKKYLEYIVWWPGTGIEHHYVGPFESRYLQETMKTLFHDAFIIGDLKKRQGKTLGVCYRENFPTSVVPILPQAIIDFAGQLELS